MKVLYLPAGADAKQGVDDYLAAGHDLPHLRQHLRAGLPNLAELPAIVVNGRHLEAIADDCWGVIEEANADAPVIFGFGSELARIHHDGDQAGIQALDATDVSHFLERRARFVQETKDGPVPARLPADVNADLRGAWIKPVPELKGLTRTPIVTPDGDVIAEPGYQPETGLYYDPIGAAVPAVPETPTPGDLTRALALLCDEWLTDFPFVGDASRANTLAMVLTPLVREMIDGPTPLHAIDAPTAGTGKGFLAQTTGIIALGAEPAAMAEPRDGEEFRKRVTALLIAGATLILIDNVKGELAAAELAAVLTAPWWEDRLLGASRMVRVPNRALWIVTGNNLRIDFDLARRTVPIRLDPKVDRPWERAGFRHDPLIPWVKAERHELVWALLVLVRHWVSRGRPAWQGTPMGSFESWTAVIGGILEAAGITGFLTNRDELYEHADTDSGEWRSFIGAWASRHGTSPVTVQQLRRIVEDGHLPYLFARGDVSDRALDTKLGIALRARRDQRIGQFFLRYVEEAGKTKAKTYRLEPVAEPPDEGSAEVPPPNPPMPRGDSGPAEPSEPPQSRSPSPRALAAPPSLAPTPDPGSAGSAGSAEPMATGVLAAEPWAEPQPKVPPLRCLDGCGAAVPAAGRRCTACATRQTQAWAQRKPKRRRR